MLELEVTGQFRKDYKRIKKRGYNMELLERVIDTLPAEKILIDSINFWNYLRKIPD